jgi:hypothetical protein
MFSPTHFDDLEETLFIPVTSSIKYSAGMFADLIFHTGHFAECS